jgi:serine/threonine protein kinase
VTSLLEARGLDTHLARALLERQSVEYSQLHAALTKVRALRDAEPRTLALELLALGLVEAGALEEVLAALVGEESEGWRVESTVAELEIRGHLGAGGMGQVFLAKDLQTGSQVAVKTLVLGHDHELLARFQREAEAQARVDGHRNVVRIHRAGVAAGRAFLVMDAVSGGDLADRLEAGPLDPMAAARLVRDLARGLAHAHARGVLHRDLKPSNILFGEDGDPRLADFGLARLVEAQGLTQTGQILGTPSYMAPEQAHSDAQDERTDVYGLGGVLYASLTSSAPFSGGSVLATLDQVLNEPAPDPRAQAPQTPGPLAEICLRCLAKSPDDRFPSAVALADALDHFLAGDLGRAGGGTPKRLAWIALVACLALFAAAWSWSQSATPALPADTSSRPPSRPSASARELNAGEVRAKVRAVEDKLARAQLAVRYLAEGREPRAWLEDRAREPFREIRTPAASTVALLPGGRLLVATDSRRGDAEWDVQIRVAATGRHIRTLEGALQGLSPSRTRLVMTKNGVSHVVDLRSFEVLDEFKTGPLIAASFASEDSLFLQREKRISLRALGGTERPWGPRFDSPPIRVKTSPTQDLVYVASGRSVPFSLRCFTSAGAQVWAAERIFDSRVRALSVSPDGTLVACGTASGDLHVFSAAAQPPGQRKPLTTFATPLSAGESAPPDYVKGRAHDAGVRSLSWLPQGRLLSVGGKQGIMKIWEPGGKCLARNLGAGLDVVRVAIDRESGWIYLASAERGRLYWALASPTLEGRASR